MTNEPTSVFEDIEDLEKDKQLFFLWHKAHIARRIIAVLAVLNALILLFRWATAYFDIIQLATLVIFGACYFLSKKNLFVFLMIATIIYVIMLPLSIYFITYDPVYRTFIMPGFGQIIGLFLRILVIVYLIRGVIAAKKYEELSRT